MECVKIKKSTEWHGRRTTRGLRLETLVKDQRSAKWAVAHASNPEVNWKGKRGGRGKKINSESAVIELESRTSHAPRDAREGIWHGGKRGCRTWSVSRRRRITAEQSAIRASGKDKKNAPTASPKYLFGKAKRKIRFPLGRAWGEKDALGGNKKEKKKPRANQA